MQIPIRRDPYAVLGVARGQSGDEVRHAFRELATRYHPDQAGGGSEPRYEEVMEAYRDLSSPRAGGPAPAEISPRPAVAPERGPRQLGALSLFRDFRAPRSALAQMFERLLRNFTGVRVPKAEALRPLDLELTLSAEDARSGGLITLSLPTFRKCPACAGAGHGALFTCFACRGSGLFEDVEPVRLVVPPGVASGTVFHLPLRGLGIGNLLLRVRVRADA